MNGPIVDTTASFVFNVRSEDQMSGDYVIRAYSNKAAPSVRVIRIRGDSDVNEGQDGQE